MAIDADGTGESAFELAGLTPARGSMRCALAFLRALAIAGLTGSPTGWLVTWTNSVPMAMPVQNTQSSSARLKARLLGLAPEIVNEITQSLNGLLAGQSSLGVTCRGRRTGFRLASWE